MLFRLKARIPRGAGFTCNGQWAGCQCGFDGRCNKFGRISFGELADQGGLFRHTCIQAVVDPPPQAADFIGRFAARRELADCKARGERILMVVAHDDERPCEHIDQVACCIVAECVCRFVDAPATYRRLVEDEGKRFFPTPDDAKRRGAGLDVSDAGTRRYDAEVGVADRRRRCRAEAARRVDDDERGAIPFQRVQARFESSAS